MAYFLAIDLGTTGCRSCIFDSSLHQISDSYQEYGIQTPHEKWVEQDADLWWTLTLQTAADAIRRAGISPGDIRSISISSQSITIVPVDHDLVPLRPAISWLDTRASAQAEWLKTELGFEATFIHTGKQITSAYSAAKILWIRDECPEIYEKTWKFLTPLDFLIAKFTGVCITDHSVASGTLLYDIKNQCWSPSILSKCGLSEDQLPLLGWSGESVGVVLPTVAEQLGLRRDCIVAIGAQDQKCAALSAGLSDTTMTVSLGTCAAICKLWSEAKTEDDMRIGWSSYVTKGKWLTEAVVNTGSVCLRWLRDTIFHGDTYENIDRQTAEAYSRKSGLLFYPYLNGPSSPENYASAEGCFYGISLATTTSDFALAVLEGVAFQIRRCLDAMNAAGQIDSIILFGGGSKSKIWCQIIADITGMKVIVPDTAEAACAGAAILAGIASKNFTWDSYPTLSQKFVYVPNKNTFTEEQYEKYCNIGKRLWEN